jgi:predicted NAD/FAD-binding protein
MNSLQSLPGKTNYFVSLNAHDIVNPETVVKTMEYYHPLFSLAAIDAQTELKKLNAEEGRNILFCGSYMRYGFHEDAFSSGVDVASILLGGVHAHQYLHI